MSVRLARIMHSATEQGGKMMDLLSFHLSRGSSPPSKPGGQDSRKKTHAYRVKVGNWIREHRGIYRLADFPTAERPDLMLWYLWSQNRQEVLEGTYSHDTALSLHELSDIMPSKLHMTVPKHFRRNSRIPEVLVLHRADLSESDIEQMQGVRVTRPLGTVLDLLQTGHVDRNLIRQAIDEAMRRGLIIGKQIDSLPHDRLRDSFRALDAVHQQAVTNIHVGVFSH